MRGNVNLTDVSLEIDSRASVAIFFIAYKQNVKIKNGHSCGDKNM